MRLLIVIEFLVMFAGSAQSAPFTYLCQAGGRPNVLTVDETGNKLVWQGKTFKIKTTEVCGKYGWHAERQGESFDFCTATQGYADFEENGSRIQCEQYLSAKEAANTYKTLSARKATQSRATPMVPDNAASGTKVTTIPLIFRGTWRLQDGSLTPCATKREGDKDNQNTAIIDATTIRWAPDLGHFNSGTISTFENGDGLAINSLSLKLNWSNDDDNDLLQSDVWSVKEISGQKVLIMLRGRNNSFDLLTKCLN